MLSCELSGYLIQGLSVIWKFQSSFFKYFFCSFFSYFHFWHSNYVYVMYFEIVSQFLDVLLRIFSSFFYLRFTLGSPCWPFFKVTGSFLGQVTTPEDPIKDIFHSYCSSMNSGIPFLFSFTVSICLPPLRCLLFPLGILAYLS